MTPRRPGEARPTIAAVIPTFGRGARLSGSIGPLLAQAELDELIVVVDGSRDGSMEIVEGFAERDRRVVAMFIENRGQMLARLAGAQRANTDVVLTIDDDVIARPGLLAGHAARHAEGRRRVVLGYMPVSLRAHRRGDFPRQLYAREYERAARAWEADPDTVLTSFWAGNFSLRREDWVALDAEIVKIPSFYHEDRDFGLRCLAAGMEGVFDRSLLATHMYERSPEKYLADARSSAQGLINIREEHGEGSSQVPEDFATAGLRQTALPVVRLAARHRRAMSLLLRAIDLAGLLKIRPVERFGGSLAWRAEQLRTSEGAR